uniref:ATP synthase F0 subunit 9 n=1 Tax=Aneura pinguis TaxID=39026 RepID=A0A0E3JVC3_ANEPI|nr:ATP synthase F0 subunit 9 [Aneura pinguis]AKA63328.1 ATP synthase F0 subunit 9 [Aneura pinguis]AKU36870.1 ATP synthase F0 subunit 9 [Aneura pinguis]AMF83687.1 ATP synthase F0 subunit 9 [Aneura pinguis]
MIHSVARNPSLAKQSFGYAILGFALTEAIASFASMTASSISFVFQCAANIYSSFLFDSLKRAPQGSNVLYVRALPSPHARERAQ